VHEIRVVGEFGRLTVRVENLPSRTNPRTSQLAAFSAIATLKNLTRSLRVGT
jgi:aspartate dehydrogenase